MNDVVDRVCPACLERLDHEVKQVRHRYHELSLNFPPAALVAALFTVASVLLGQVLFIAYEFHRYGREHRAQANWDHFVATVPSILWDTGDDTVFALLGGLLGAFYAARGAGTPTVRSRWKSRRAEEDSQRSRAPVPGVPTSAQPRARSWASTSG